MCLIPMRHKLWNSKTPYAISKMLCCVFHGLESNPIIVFRWVTYRFMWSNTLLFFIYTYNKYQLRQLYEALSIDHKEINDVEERKILLRYADIGRKLSIGAVGNVKLLLYLLFIHHSTAHCNQFYCLIIDLVIMSFWIVESMTTNTSLNIISWMK